MFWAATIGPAIACALREPRPVLALPVGSRFSSAATDGLDLPLLLDPRCTDASLQIRVSGLALRRELLYWVQVLSLLSSEGSVD